METVVLRIDRLGNPGDYDLLQMDRVVNGDAPTFVATAIPHQNFSFDA